MASPHEATDGWVRIPRSELASVPVFHFASEVDMTIALPEGVASDAAAGVVTGFTEWVGEWRDAQLSVGWDWGVVAGQIIVLHPAEIRSNVRLVMDDGTAASAMLTRVHLLAWIETLPWRGSIAELLQSRK